MCAPNKSLAWDLPLELTTLLVRALIRLTSRVVIPTTIGILILLYRWTTGAPVRAGYRNKTMTRAQRAVVQNAALLGVAGLFFSPTAVLVVALLGGAGLATRCYQPIIVRYTPKIPKPRKSIEAAPTTPSEKNREKQQPSYTDTDRGGGGGDSRDRVLVPVVHGDDGCRARVLVSLNT